MSKLNESSDDQSALQFLNTTGSNRLNRGYKLLFSLVFGITKNRDSNPFVTLFSFLFLFIEMVALSLAGTVWPVANPRLIQTIAGFVTQSSVGKLSQTYLTNTFIVMSLLVITGAGIMFYLSYFQSKQKPINISIRYALRVVVIFIFSVLSAPILGTLLAPALCSSDGSHQYYPSRGCFESGYAVQFGFAILMSVVHVVFSVILNTFLLPLLPKHRGFYSVPSLPLTAFIFIFLLSNVLIVFLTPNSLMLHSVFMCIGSAIILGTLFILPPFYNIITNLGFTIAWSIIFVISVFSIFASLKADPISYSTAMSPPTQILFWIFFFVLLVGLPVGFGFLMHLRLTRSYYVKPPNFVVPIIKQKKGILHNEIDEHSLFFSDAPPDETDAPRPTMEKLTMTYFVEIGLRFIFDKRVRHSLEHLNFVSSVYEHAIQQFPSSTSLILKSALFEASFQKNYLKAQKLIQQATIGYPHFFNQWTIFSIGKELDDMVEAERVKMNDDPMQGLGMNDGDKGGGTGGAQAKLETTKMISLAVLNLLDQPSYSVDRLHCLALLAARKAKETFEDITKQLLISPNSVALWKMMRTVVVDLLNDDTAKDGLDSIITKLEKKATAKKASEQQSLFVGEENERLLQFEVSAKTVHSTTKQFQIVKHTSRRSKLVILLIVFCVLFVLGVTGVSISFFLVTSKTEEILDMTSAIGKISLAQMSAVVLAHDLFEHLAAPTLVGGWEYMQDLEWMHENLERDLDAIQQNTKTALFDSLDSLNLWSASDKSAFKKEEGFTVVFPNLSPASPFSSTTEFHGLLDTIGDITYAISASSSLLASPTVFTDADEHESLLREIVFLMTSGPLCVVEPMKFGMSEILGKHERNVEVTFLTMIVVLVVLEVLVVVVYGFIWKKLSRMKKGRKRVLFSLMALSKSEIERRKGKMDEDEEEGIANAQSNELDMNDNLPLPNSLFGSIFSSTPRKSLGFTPRHSLIMNPQLPLSMTPRKSLTMSPITGPTSAPRKSLTTFPLYGPAMTPRKSLTMTPLNDPSLHPRKSLTLSPLNEPTLNPRKSLTTSPLKAPTGQNNPTNMVVSAPHSLDETPNVDPDSSEKKEDEEKEPNKKDSDDVEGEVPSLNRQSSRENDETGDDDDDISPVLLKTLNRRRVLPSSNLPTPSPFNPSFPQSMPTPMQQPAPLFVQTSLFTPQPYTPLLGQAAGKQTTSLFQTNTPNDSESPDMVTQTSSEPLIKVSNTPSETKPRRMVLELVDERVEESILDVEMSDELALTMANDAHSIHSIFSRPTMLCLGVGPVFVLGALTLTFVPMLTGKSVYLDTACHPFSVVVRNAVALQVVFLTQQLVYNNSFTLEDNPTFALCSNPVWKDTSHLTTDTDALRDTIKQAVKYLEMLNQIAVFGNEALDATLTAGVSDTVLSKLKIPRTRGLFPAADEFSTATRDCFLRNEPCEPDRIPGWMGTFVGLDNVLAWLVSNTEQLVTLPAAELTPNNKQFGVVYKLGLLDGRDGVETYLEYVVGGHSDRLESRKMSSVVCFVVGAGLTVLFLVMFFIPPVRTMQKGENETMSILHLVGWKRKTQSSVGEIVSSEKKGGVEVEMEENVSEDVDSDG